jgi:hypothetical protein
LKYRDIEYSVVQGIERQVWKWSISVSDTVRTGQAGTKPEAAKATERAIDQALASRHLRLVGPDDH